MSQEALAVRWKWSKNKVRRFLKELEKNDQISLKTELKNIAVSTLITITNYEEYQRDETEDETENGTEERPKTKPKTAPEQEVKERKEGKEEITIPKKRFVPPSLELVSEYCQERKNGIDPQGWMDHYSSNGWMVGKNKMKDWKAAVRTWEKNQFRKNGGINAGEDRKAKWRSLC